MYFFQVPDDLIFKMLKMIYLFPQVPRIFIDGQCVGGNSDLKTLDKTGRLGDMLKNVPSTT